MQNLFIRHMFFFCYHFIQVSIEFGLMFICGTIYIIEAVKAVVCQKCRKDICSQIHITGRHHTLSLCFCIVKKLQHFLVRHQCIPFQLDFVGLYFIPVNRNFGVFRKHLINIIHVGMGIFICCIHPAACLILLIHTQFSEPMDTKMLAYQIKNSFRSIGFPKEQCIKNIK